MKGYLLVVDVSCQSVRLIFTAVQTQEIWCAKEMFDHLSVNAGIADKYDDVQCLGHWGWISCCQGCHSRAFAVRVGMLQQSGLYRVRNMIQCCLKRIKHCFSGFR